MPVIRINVLNKEGFGGLDGILTRTGLKGMLERKDYKALDKVFHFVAALLDLSTGHAAEALLTKVHPTYSEIVMAVIADEMKMLGSTNELERLDNEVKCFLSASG